MSKTEQKIICFSIIPQVNIEFLTCWFRFRILLYFVIFLFTYLRFIAWWIRARASESTFQCFSLLVESKFVYNFAFFPVFLIFIVLWSYCILKQLFSSGSVLYWQIFHNIFANIHFAFREYFLNRSALS
jgi:hypothetical protein